MSTLGLYLKPTYKYGLLLDKGHYTHHFTYTGAELAESAGEIPFSGKEVAYLSRQWSLAAFSFGDTFYMTVDVRTGYRSHVTGDTSQVIFRKLRNGTEKLASDLQ